MIFKLFRKIKLALKPLKQGDVLYGNCADFKMSSGITQIRHGLRSIEGDLVFTYWHGYNTYRVTILNASMPYYIFDGEVLTRDMDSLGQFVWKKRTSPNRMWKRLIHDMIVEGKLARLEK